MFVKQVLQHLCPYRLFVPNPVKDQMYSLLLELVNWWRQEFIEIVPELGLSLNKYVWTSIGEDSQSSWWSCLEVDS